jgi:hypothetical protein
MPSLILAKGILSSPTRNILGHHNRIYRQSQPTLHPDFAKRHTASVPSANLLKGHLLTSTIQSHRPVSFISVQSLLSPTSNRVTNNSKLHVPSTPLLGVSFEEMDEYTTNSGQDGWLMLILLLH